MNLIYLSEANLRDRLFVKDFVHNFKWQSPTIIVHEAFGGTVQDTYFVTKRLSALLSECMVHNHAFLAGQRRYFYMQEGSLKADRSKIEPLFAHIHVVVFGPVLQSQQTESLLQPTDMLDSLKQVFEVSEVVMFCDNPLSPLGSKKVQINDPAEMDKWTAVYEEEKTAIARAFRHQARICSPVNYSM